MNMQVMERLWLAAATATALMLTAQARADDAAFTGAETVRLAAEQAVTELARHGGSKVTANAATLDPRLRLQRCVRPLRTFIAGDGQLHDVTTVSVRCEEPVRWTVYVRVAVNAELPVLSARRLLPRGSALTAEDFELRTRQVPGLGDRHLRDYQSLAGTRLRQPMAAGEMLTTDKLEQAALVRRGQQVTLLARTSAMEVRVAAVALSDGQPQQRINVQNVNTRQVVEAIVRSSELVEVPL